MVIGEGTNEIQRLVIARGLLARARLRAERRPRCTGVPASSPEHLVGVLRRGAAPADRAHGHVREAHRAVDRPPDRRAALHLDEAVVGQQLRVLDHLGRRLRRRPPDALAVEPLRPLGQGSLGDDLVEEGDELGAVPADGRGVGEALVLEQVGSAEGAADRADVAVGLETGEEEPPPVGGPVGVHQRRLVVLPGLGRGDLAEHHLQAQVPAEHVGAGAQQRDLDHPARPVAAARAPRPGGRPARPAR